MRQEDLFLKAEYLLVHSPKHNRQNIYWFIIKNILVKIFTGSQTIQIRQNIYWFTTKTILDGTFTGSQKTYSSEHLLVYKQKHINQHIYWFTTKKKILDGTFASSQAKTY